MMRKNQLVTLFLTGFLLSAGKIPKKAIHAFSDRLLAGQIIYAGARFTDYDTYLDGLNYGA